MSNTILKNKDIAVIMTCHNRQAKTLECLDSLFSSGYNFSVYLTDDGCTDGTSEAVKAKYPQVNIIKGDGNLFWSRGMYTAWKEAISGNYSYYLWVNDDIKLNPDFMNELERCEELKGGDCIITGLVADKESGETIYGGNREDKSVIEPSGMPERVTFMNGNLVLIPDSVVEKIGIMDPVLHHDLGDVDYGLRAIEHGIGVFTTGAIVATGYVNDYCRIRRWGTNIFNRFKVLNTPLGSPLSLNFYFRKKHFGTLKALFFCAHLILLNVLPDIIVGHIRNKMYAK